MGWSIACIACIACIVGEGVGMTASPSAARAADGLPLKNAERRPLDHTARDDDGEGCDRQGRERRTRILQDAMGLFAQEGYGDTSLRDIAKRVGMSKSTLLHYYASKEKLLGAVLRERDRLIGSHSFGEPTRRAVDELRALPLGAAHNAAQAPGLIEVYAVLSSEAVPASHPAHAYFEERFRIVINHFTALFRAAKADGDLPAHRDPDFEAVWLTALWDGLQYQWLYDPDSVDIPAELAIHLQDVLPPI